MSMATTDLARAMAGLMAIEKRIIELAEQKNLRGLRFEWNDDIDFGHMQDPVPVDIYAPDGHTVEAEFSLEELSQYLGRSHAATDSKLDDIVDVLTAAH